MGYVHKDADVGSARGLFLDRKAFGTKNQYTAALPAAVKPRHTETALKPSFRLLTKEKFREPDLKKHLSFCNLERHIGRGAGVGNRGGLWK